MSETASALLAVQAKLEADQRVRIAQLEADLALMDRYRIARDRELEQLGKDFADLARHAHEGVQDDAVAAFHAGAAQAYASAARMADRARLRAAEEARKG
jgi:hypothetical protein